MGMFVAFLFHVFSKRVTLQHVLILATLQLVIAGISVAVVYHSSVSDTETWNGFITEKYRDKVGCEHSYQCNCIEICSTDSKGYTTCTQSCSVCFEHDYDYDWVIKTSNDEKVKISRVDSQGIGMPLRFQSAYIGEPTAIAHSYVNYIKAAPDTLFRRQGSDASQYKIPDYPKIYDYYRQDRILNTSSRLKIDVSKWDRLNDTLNAVVGSPKQANIIMVFTDVEDSGYIQVLEERWLGGKKNDIVITIGVDQSGKRASWVGVSAWTTREIFKVKLRDHIREMPDITDEVKMIQVIQSDVEKYYERKPMADFEYLKSSITPSSTQWILVSVISMIVSAIVSMLLISHRSKFNLYTYRTSKFRNMRLM